MIPKLFTDSIYHFKGKFIRPLISDIDKYTGRIYNNSLIGIAPHSIIDTSIFFGTLLFKVDTFYRCNHLKHEF